MAKPITKEQLDLMIEVVKSEIELANDLLKSYQEDLENTKNDKSLSEEERNKKIEQINQSIKESQEFLNLRKKNLKDIDPLNSGKKAREARQALWYQHEKSGETLGTVGMDTVWNQRKNQARQAKHQAEEAKKAKERQETDRQVESEKAKAEAEKAKAEALGKEVMEQMRGESFRPNPITPDLNKKLEEEKAKEEANPKPKDSRESVGEDFSTYLNPIDTRDASEKNTSQTSRKIKIPEQSNSNQGNLPIKISIWQRMSLAIRNFFNRLLRRPIENVNDVQTRNMDVRTQSGEKKELNNSDLTQEQIEELEAEGLQPGDNEYDQALLSYGIKTNEQIKKQEKEDDKRRIKGFSKVKMFFTDHKKDIQRIAATLLATATLATGVFAISRNNQQTQPTTPITISSNSNVVTPTPTPTPTPTQTPTQTYSPVAEADKSSEEDGLTFHDANQLTDGSYQKQYVVREGTEYTEGSLGNGKTGSLDKDSVVEIYNRAIVKDNDDGTSKIVATSNEQTWSDYAEAVGMSVEDLNSMLNQEGTREVVAIQVADTNHNIFNVYGWVDADKLEESSRGQEKIEIDTEKDEQSQENVVNQQINIVEQQDSER